MMKTTTAGLGYMEVLEFSMQILLLRQLAIVSALSTPNGGEGYNSSTDLNPITISSIQLQCIQAASQLLADKTTSKPQPKYCMYKSSLHQPPYFIYIWNKYPKRVALVTKYIKTFYTLHSLVRYFFNAASNSCETFQYGGCMGNENRFDDRESCGLVCAERTLVEPLQATLK